MLGTAVLEDFRSAEDPSAGKTGGRPYTQEG